MSKISMPADGRFGQMFVAAVNEKGISLRDVAAKFDYSYEQMRKFVQGKSVPEDEFLMRLCKFLSMNYDDALMACTGDRMERSYGAEAYKSVGKDPRLADIEPYLRQLDPKEWGMFVKQIAGYVRERTREK
jgi:transcriptional regulator with XRE-family HTH domain